MQYSIAACPEESEAKGKESRVRHLASVQESVDNVQECDESLDERS